MKIVSGNFGPLYPDRTRGVRTGDQSTTPEPRTDASSGPATTDSVDISSAARVKAARDARPSPAGDAAGIEPVPVDQPDRMKAILQRIRSGAYDSDAVRTEVARRILLRSDL
jgi:hypothetical protein